MKNTAFMQKGENAVWDTIEKRHVNANFARKWEKKLNVEVFSQREIKLLIKITRSKDFWRNDKNMERKVIKTDCREIYGTKEIQC